MKLRYLNPQLRVLKTILKAGCCSSKQVKKLLDYKSSVSASKLLKCLEDSNYVYTVKNYKGETGYVYFITRKGAEYVLNATGELEEKQDQLKYILKDKSKSKAYVSHALAVAKLYYEALKELGIENEEDDDDEEEDGFYWGLSSEAVVANDKEQKLVRGDACLEYKGKKYIFEMDMGSENKSALLTKFGRYQKVLNNMTLGDNSLYASMEIVFVINLEDDRKLYTGIPKSDDSYNKLLSIRRQIKEKEMEYKYKLLCEQKGEEELIKIRDKTNDKAQIRCIDAVLNGTGTNYEKEIKELKIEKWGVEGKNQLKLDCIMAGKYNRREKLIKDLILEPVKSPLNIENTLFYEMAKGLDIRIISEKSFKYFLQYRVAAEKSNTDRVLERALLMCKEPRVGYYEDIGDPYTELICKVSVTDKQQNPNIKPACFFIEDVTGGNVGALARVMMCNENMYQVRDKNIEPIIIVEDNEQAMEIANYINNNGGNIERWMFINGYEIFMKRYYKIMKNGLNQS